MKKWLIVLFVLGLVVSNALVYRHAAAMTDYSAGGERTNRPGSLSAIQKMGVLLSGIRLPRALISETPADLGLEFETLRFDSQSGFSIEAWRVPQESSELTVILFHGYGANKSSLIQYVSAWRKLGASVVMVDFFGSGGSSGSFTTIGAREAHDVDAAVRTVLTRWPDQRVILHGLSMGAAAVLKATSELGTQSDALVLESGYDTLLHSAQNRFRSMGLPATPFAQWLLFWGGVRHGFNPFELNPLNYAPGVEVPTLLLHGARDKRVTVEQAQALFEAFPDNAVFSLYDEAIHLGMYGSDSARWSKEVSQLLERIQ